MSVGGTWESSPSASPLFFHRVHILCTVPLSGQVSRTNKRLSSRARPRVLLILFDRRARTLFLADSCSAHKPPTAITSVIFRVPSQTTLIQTSHAADKAWRDVCTVAWHDSLSVAPAPLSSKFQRSRRFIDLDANDARLQVSRAMI